MSVDYIKVQNERLPTLYEVLLRKSSPPLDSWEFYTYLSQFPYAIDYLDFWVDLMAHIRLCREYVKGIRDSIGEIESSYQYQDFVDKNGNRVSVSSSLLLNALLNEGYLDPDNNKRVSQLLQGNTEESRYITELVNTWRQQPRIDEDQPTANLSSIIDEIIKNETRQNKQPKITRKQLINNALGICNIYLLSPKESPKYLINVPEDLKRDLVHKIQVENRHDPEVFDALKFLAYQFLEVDCFPKFLSSVALHNIHDQISNWRFDSTLKKKQENRFSRSPFSNFTVISRLTAGILWLGLGFWLGYVLIFLQYSRAIRVVTVVPFLIGSYLIVCGFYQVDIIYSWFGLTQLLINEPSLSSKEYASKPQRLRAPTFFTLLGGRSRLIVIEHPFTRRLLLKRGLWCCCLVAASTAILTVIFSCVPGYRL